MSDKLISLEAVVDLIDRSNADLIIKSERYELIEDIEALPPAELPMSAVEYLKERTRMEAWSAENCNQAILDCDDECCECPYDRVPDCKDEANRPLEAVASVYAWAREHPEVNNESGK